MIAETIQEKFGINIPTLVVKNLLKALSKRGLTANVGTTAVELTPEGHESAPALQQDIAKYNRRQADLAMAFELFVSERFPDEFDFNVTPAATMLASYFERHAAPLLDQALRGKAPAEPLPGADFASATFVTHLAESDQTRFDYVVEAAKGAMLSTVLLLDTSSLDRSLDDLTFVLDTPVLMEALGFDGDQAMLATQQLLKLAESQGARVVTFDHSVDELLGILEHVSQALRKGSRSRSTSTSYLHFVDIHASPADLASLQNKIPALLEEAGIAVVSRPDGYYEYGLDEGKLDELIQAKVRYLQDAARLHDVMSLSATHRLRKGRRMRSLEQCRAVLVTTNVNLVLGAIEFEERGSSFPLAITTDAATSVLWVRSPSTAPDAPREVLLAGAYAGMQPGPAVWTKYLEEIDALESSDKVTADEAVMLRTAQVSRQSLMQETMGRSEAVTSESPLAALERIRSSVAEPLEQRVGELKAQADAASEIADKASAGWIEHFDARQEAEAARQKMEAELEIARGSEQAALGALAKKDADDDRRFSNIAKRAGVVAHRWRLAIAAAIRILLIGVTVLAGLWFLGLDDPAGRTGVIIVGVAGFVALVLSLLPPLAGVLDSLERALAKSGERRRLVNLGFDVS